MKNLKIIFLLIFGSIINAQQQNDSIKYISSSSLEYKGNNIKSKIVNTILNKEQKSNLSNIEKLTYLNTHFYIKEILAKSLLDDGSQGIFIIIPSTSHSPYYLLLLDNKIKIIDFKDFNNTILEALNYFNKRNISEELKYNYLMEILKFYEINKNSTAQNL